MNQKSSEHKHVTECDLHNNVEEAYVFIDVAYNPGPGPTSSAAAMVAIPGVGIQPLSGLHFSVRKSTKYEMYEAMVLDIVSTVERKMDREAYSSVKCWVVVTDNSQLVQSLIDDDPTLTEPIDSFLLTRGDEVEFIIDLTPDQDCPCMTRVRNYAHLIMNQRNERMAQGIKHFKPGVDRVIKSGGRGAQRKKNRNNTKDVRQ